MMVHWGLYSLLGGEYKGEHSCSYAEWIQSYFRIPVAEYDKLATAFNPIYFNAEEWVLLAKRAGMKYLVITSKHHDGFALFDSRCDGFNVKKATPFGRDVIGEIAAACKKHGLKLGLYYSQELDWHEPNGGGYHPSHLNIDDTHWTNNWDFPDDDHKNYEQCFRAKILPQIREILTKYPIKTRLNLKGTLIVARDIAHARIKQMLDEGKPMPEYFKNHPVYYAGPAKTPAGYASGSFGPTTAGRMDPYVDLFQKHGGSMVMVAKGNRSKCVTDACHDNGGFYLGSIGGPAAILAKNSIKSVEVVDFPELGMEAVRKIYVENFPAFIIVDDKGNDFFAEFAH